jgi:hypothetical protein
LIYAADSGGCGYHRMIWPTRELLAQGHDVVVVDAESRHVRVGVTRDGRVVSVDIPDGVDVVVFQRITHSWLVGVVEFLVARGVAVVIDVDDDLTTIHPENPAWLALHPRREGARYEDGRTHMHSWAHLTRACQLASLVTVSAPALLSIYAAHGRGRVISNYLAPHYYDVPHDDSEVVGWPASLHSHPNDPDVLGPAISRLVDQGIEFQVVGDATGCGRAFMLGDDPPSVGPVDLLDWPEAVAQLGIGIVPLADTKFNSAKSWLKGLEMAAVGVPWVGSPRVEYRRLHALGCGLLADRPKDWYRTLRRLIDDVTLRVELSEAGRAVARTLRLDQHAWRWAEAWSDALDWQRSRAGVSAARRVR